MKLTIKLGKILGNKLHIDFNKIPFEEFYRGIEIEQEHNYTFNPDFPTERSLYDWIMYARIARDHLVERTDYYSQLIKMEKQPVGKSELKESIRKIIKRELKESHFPPKALDFNNVPDVDNFWGCSLHEISQKAGLNPLSTSTKTIGDVIFWLNMAVLYWKSHREIRQH